MLAEGSYEQAEEWARSIVRECLDHDAAILIIARAAEAQGRDKSAALQYTKYAFLTRSPGAYERAADLYVRGDWLHDAAECYEKAAQFAKQQHFKDADRLSDLSERFWKTVQAAPEKYPPSEL